MSEDETTEAPEQPQADEPAPDLPEFDMPDDSASDDSAASDDIALQEMSAPAQNAPVPLTEKTAAELESVFDIPVRISVILGRAKVPVADLLKMDAGTVFELDRQVGEAIEVFVNDRLIARGEIVLVENKLGVTMTEIIKAA